MSIKKIGINKLKEKKHWIRFLVFVILFVFGSFVTYKTTIVTRMPRPHLNTIVKPAVVVTENGKEHLTMALEDNQVYEQDFTYPEEYLISVGTSILLGENEKNEGILLAELYDEDTMELLGQSEYDLAELANDQLLMVSLGERKGGFKDRQLIYRLSVRDLGQPEIKVYVDVQKEMYIVAADRQLTYWKYLFLLGAAVLFMTILYAYLGLEIFELKFENVFLGVGLAMAALMLVMLPPMSVPDEQDHMVSAYEKVNSFYGLDTESPETAYMLKADYEAMQEFRTSPTMMELDTIRKELFTATREEGSLIVPHTNMRAPLLGYLPGVIAIFLARLIGLNGYMLWMLGRVIAIIFYLLFMYLAIKIIPFGKAAMFIIAILPMTVQQCCSYSYDGLLIECTCIIIAVLLKAMSESRQEALKKYEIIVLLYACIMTALCKGGCYMPLVLLVVFVPNAKFASTKKAWITKLGLIGVTGFAWLANTLSYVMYVLAPTGSESTTLSYTDAEAYTLSDILHNLWIFIIPAVRTAINDMSGYFLSMFGTQLGWLEIEVTYWLPIIMFIMILISVIPLEGHENEGMISIPFKIGIIFCCGVTLGLVFMSMFLDWTPKESLVIWGIQGRYFLPLLPAIMLLFRTKYLVIKKSFDKYLIFIAVAFQCVVFYDILLALENNLI